MTTSISLANYCSWALGATAIAIALQSTCIAEDLSPNGHHRKNVPEQTSGELETFTLRLATIHGQIPQGWMVRFPDRKIVPKPLITEVGMLYDEMLAWTDGNLWSASREQALDEKWAATFDDVFTLRVMLEWQDFQISWNEFQKLQKMISSVSKQVPDDYRHILVAALADPILRLWIGLHTKEIMAWIKVFEEDLLSDGTGKLPEWWLRDRCDYSMGISANTQDQTFAPVANQWILEYLRNTEISETSRAFIVTRSAINLHSLGRPHEALRILDWWENQNPESCLKNPSFIHACFFVNQIGLADRNTARQQLSRMDNLIEINELSAEDDRYRIIQQSYYNHLMYSDLEHLLVTIRVAEARHPRIKE